MAAGDRATVSGRFAVAVSYAAAAVSLVAVAGASHHPFPVDRAVAKSARNGEPSMLYTIAVILVVLWLLGLVSSYTMGGFIHVLLVIAVVIVLLQVIQGRRG
jgi:hypothetical protein